MDKVDAEVTQPLLSVGDHDVENQNANHGPVHVCARCATEMRGGTTVEDPNGPGVKIHARGALLFVASALSLALFILSIVIMSMSYRKYFFVGELFVCLWSFTTQVVLCALIYAGWPHRRKRMPKLSKTTAQIKVLCLLALSWIPLATGAIIETDDNACPWDSICAPFVLVNILIWFLMIALYGAAFATYRRAVKIHGKELVQNPQKIPAWRLSEVNGAEGMLKL
ncbi:hypothetical protein MIND_00114700 [Mycena indigotica]|uniref:Uncharacterized protein n=1 Tax=Mycena indigotica TaxID=2126181 RepID=A0A8H6WFP3_9AGAR|nr:uncharacterized protein MIND_00114700 [Mycena indigotica]KAF7315977.1 hypothetical protein MIND_00114700 [Mycena indigotica]